MDLNLMPLRSKKTKEVAAHILHLLQDHPATDICNALLSAVDLETLRPHIFSIFLSAAKSIDCIRICLHQPHSILVRRLAIKHYGRALRDPRRWEEAWHGIGSTEGILRYLKNISVVEVKLFFASVGNCSHGQNKPHERAKAVEQLLKAMFSSQYPEGAIKTEDKRSLEDYAIRLVPACSSAFVRDLVVQGSKNRIYSECSQIRLIKTHGSMLRDYVVHTMFQTVPKKLPGDVDYYLQQFTSREPPLPSDEHKFSASMIFSENLLKKRLQQADALWPSQRSESTIYFGLLERCIHKRVTKRRLHEVMALGMDLLKAREESKSDFTSKHSVFWALIVEYWGKWPEHWEDLFVQGMQLGLAGGQWSYPEAFISVANGSNINKERSWYLLRLLSLHLPKNGVDIEATSDLTVFAKHKWHIKIFQTLPDEKAIGLLKELLRVNNHFHFDFLRGTPKNSILGLPWVHDQANFHALLFLTQLQAQSTDSVQRTEAAERAKEAVADLRSRSASSREQQDRALFAKAACFFAIASGSLDLYASTVEWLQRFVRDPLTVKVIFAEDAIASTEGSDLLCGIPYSQSEITNLNDISMNVAKANQILLEFHAHKQLTKREPSYQFSDWTALLTLLRKTIKARIARAQLLQTSIDASQGELYSAIWSQTIAMFSQVGSESMREIQWDMQSLMIKLPPTTLATTTKAMLETDNRYRATKSEGKEAEDESRIVEGLTYQCLLALAKGDKPALAEELIVRTIIDRPDASSWHRQLLSISFFKRLPAKNAEQLLLGFAKAIGEKLEEQSYVRIGEAAGKPSLVKVTTVKYLAQLLQDAKFLSAEASIDVLVELFKVATHPDIRLATLESMLSALNGLCTSELHSPVTDIKQIKNPLIRNILNALDAVIPVVGSINERRPPGEQDWAEAREDLSKLPMPLSDSFSRPLWSELVSAAARNDNLESYFVERLLLPILKTSMEEHRKWLSLFLQKHHAEFSIDRVAGPLPVYPLMMRELMFPYTPLLPPQVLSALDTYTQLVLKTPSHIRAFNAKLKNDEEKRNKPDVKHWLSVFDRSTDQILQETTLHLIRLIHHDWEPSRLAKGKGIELNQVQTAIVNQLNIVLQAFDKNVLMWSNLTEQLRHPTSSVQQYANWSSDCRPVLEHIIQMVEGMRTPQWLRNPDRQPSALPSTSKLKLWLLRHPVPANDDVMAVNEESEALALQLLQFIKGQLGSRIGSVRADKLAADIMTVSAKLDANANVQTCLVLGSYGQISDHVEEIVRVDMALKFLEAGSQALKKDKELKGKVKNMIKAWERSFVEEVRERVTEFKLPEKGLWKEVFNTNDSQE